MAYDGTLKFDTLIDSSGFQQGINKISSIAKTGIKTTTAVLTGAVAAVGAVGTSAIKVGSEFEAGMSKVEAISGATKSELEELTKKAKEMGAKTKFSATESAAAFEYMSMAGWKTGDMLSGIEGIMNLAAASGEDLATTSDIVTDALTAFGMSAADSSEFADTLAAASSSANTNVSMMGETFKYVAPVAGALGFSAKDCAVAIGLMANSGIKASQAGTALRSTFSRMAKPTKEVAAAMDALGISMTDDQGKMKSLSEIMKDLRDGFSGLTEAEKTQMAATIGGQEAMSGLLAIVNASDKDFNDLTEAIYGSEGAAERMAETMMDNLPGALEEAGGAVETMGLMLYEHMQEPLKDTVKAVTSIIDDVNATFEKDGFSGLPKAFGRALSELFQMAVDSAPMLIDAAVELCGAFLDEIRNNPDFAESGAELVVKIVTAILELSGMFWGAAAQLVIQLVQGFADHLPEIIQSGKDMVQAVIDGISEELPGIGALLDGFFDGFVSTVEPALTVLADIIKDVFDVINDADPAFLESVGRAIGVITAGIVGLNVTKKAVNGVTSLIGKFNEITELAPQCASKIGDIATKISTIPQSVSSAMSGMAGTVTGIGGILAGAAIAVTNFVDMFQNGFSIVKSLLMGVGIAIAAVGAVILGAPAAVAAVVAGVVFAVANLVILIKEHFDEIVQFASNLVSDVATWFSKLPGRIGESLDRAINGLVSWGSQMIESATSTASSLFKSVMEWFSKLPYRIGYVLGKALGTLVKFGVDAVNWVVTNVPKIINNIVRFFSQLPGKIWIWLTTALTRLATWGAYMLTSARNAAKNAVNAVVQFFSQLPGKIWSWLTTAAQKVVQWGSNLASRGRQAASKLVNAVVNGVASLPGRMLQIGSEIVNGVWQGIQNAAGSFMSNVRSFFSGIVDGAKSALGIHSPSKVFATEVGAWIPPGIGEGFEKQMPVLERGMESEMSALAGKMKAAVDVEMSDIYVEKHSTVTYEAQKDRKEMEDRDTVVEITGETHVHVDLDGEEVGHATVPTVDRDMSRIDKHKQRGG